VNGVNVDFRYRMTLAAEILESRPVASKNSNEGQLTWPRLAVIGIGAPRIGADGRDAKGKLDPSQLRAYAKQVFRAAWAQLRELGSAGKKR
jgi:hypothetical protein